MEENLFDKNINKISRVLNKSKKNKYYKELYCRHGIDIDSIDNYEKFKQIPILTKEKYKENTFNLLSQLIDPSKASEYFNINDDFNEKKKFLNPYGLYVKVTSGSTGKPMEIIKSNEDILRDYISLNLARRKVTDYNFRGNFLWIWPVNKYTRKYFYTDKKSNYYKVNEYGYQIMISEYNTASFNDLYHFIINYKIEWLTSSPSVITYFAKFLNERKLIVNTLKYIECHSEPLLNWQKGIISDTFNVEPHSVYSSNEVQFMAMQCPYGKMHVVSNNCFIEAIDLGKGYPEVCVTSLNYMDIPIIRYQLGDCAEWDENQDCLCRLKQNPIIKLKGYRTNDFIITKNHTMVEPFVVTDSIILAASKFGITFTEYKVKQTEYDHFVYFLDEVIVSNISNVTKLKTFLEAYLDQILDYPVLVDIVSLKTDENMSNQSKYKYIEVSNHLKGEL